MWVSRWIAPWTLPRSLRTNNIPFFQSRLAADCHFSDHRRGRRPLTVSPLANTLGFVPLPPLYWLLLAILLLGYTILTQGVKTWFIRRFGE
jgi:P-type Mg2+ transporter